MTEPKFIDTHGHVQFNAFADDHKEVISRTMKLGGWIVMPSTQIGISKRAVSLANEYEEGVYAAIGLHPAHLDPTRIDNNELSGDSDEGESFDPSLYEKLLGPKVVAVGEIGLDYWRRPKTTARREAYVAKQKEAFVSQLDFAHEHNLPVIIHCRVAFDDTYEIVKNHPISKRDIPGVIHSFTGEKKDLENFLHLGFMIAYNALIFILPHLPDVVAQTPIDRMVLETDSPYLTPPALEKDGGYVRNEPQNILLIAQEVSKLTDVSYEDILKETTQNARKLFNI